MMRTCTMKQLPRWVLLIILSSVMPLTSYASDREEWTAPGAGQFREIPAGTRITVVDDTGQVVAKGVRGGGVIRGDASTDEQSYLVYDAAGWSTFDRDEDVLSVVGSGQRGDIGSSDVTSLRPGGYVVVISSVDSISTLRNGFKFIPISDRDAGRLTDDRR